MPPEQLECLETISFSKRFARLSFLGPAPLQKRVGDFCCVNLEDFARDFPGGFSGHFFPQE